MTAVAYSVENIGRYQRITWVLANGQDGAPLAAGEDFADRSVQVLGTFGAGGTVVFEGSNDDGTTYATLDDNTGTALSLTAAKLKAIATLAHKMRPRVTAGDGTTALTVVCFIRRGR